MTPASPGIAVVGGGFMAAVHSRAARAAGGRLLGVVASTPERSAEVASSLGFERGYASLDELLQDPAVDVVHVCTPNALHAEQALAAIAAGKHVVCEKPLATDAETAARLVEAAEEAGIVATVPFVYRFHPLVREARARVAAGDLGTLVTISGSYLQDWLLSQTDDNWRVDAASGGRSRAFADIGSHLVDLIEFVTGARITELSSTLRTVFAERANTASVTTEDAAAVVIRLAGGAIGTLLVSQVAPGRKNRLHIEVAGTELSIGFDQEAPETLWLGKRAGSQIIPRDADQLHPDAARLSIVPSGHPMGYQDAFNGFIADSYAAMAGQSPEGLPVFADGLRAVRITEAVLDAAADGTWVRIPSPAEESRTTA
ncbi:MAG TPA: Gfo/Idh/MocA family oxidoreductase [Plantibacter sp.]|uniref:Gfo/Idh/MocA family protein n=1 Tax=unclassified Plantibacter TaxID=2624265 RepID=UPI002CF05347|nr:Gfo/Idh/MocA family oxidoreductase [Plantibacter sp.]